MDFNTKLIELVRNHKSIYDTSDPNYGDHARKHEAWKEIARKLETHENECKKSWILLREGYRRFLKKQIALENDPTHRKDTLTRKWTYEDDMSFLSPHFKKRYLYSINNNIIVEENSPDRDHPTVPATPEITAQKSALLKHTKTHEVVSRRSSSHETNPNTLIKYILDKTMKRDDVQQFFDSMSSTVQLFPLRDKALAKAKVFEVISKIELEILDRGSANSSQYTSSPASDDMEVTESRNNLYITPSPEPCRPSSGMLEANNSCDDDTGPELDIKIEPEQIFGFNIKQETK